jgi:hypothetical protein
MILMSKDRRIVERAAQLLWNSHQVASISRSFWFGMWFKKVEFIVKEAIHVQAKNYP